MDDNFTKDVSLQKEDAEIEKLQLCYTVYFLQLQMATPSPGLELFVADNVTVPSDNK